MDPIVLVCSVRLEAEALLAGDALKPLGIRRLDAWTGRVGRSDIYLVVGGMGKTNAARSLTALLENRSASAVIGFGVGGAYLDRGLEPGDLALASSEHYGDEGVDTPQGWMSCEGIGIPLLESADAKFFNDFPVGSPELAAAQTALSREGLIVVSGPFVTVSTCSGTAGRGYSISERFGAVCETMEGAAYAHVAALYELPFIEIRGISNMVEDRNMAAWQLRRAAGAATDALPVVIEAVAGARG